MIRDNITIQHAANIGEHMVGIYKVDGYCSKTNTVYEFHGDYYHGNPNVFKMTDYNKVCGKMFMELYVNTIKKDHYIRKQGYKIVTIRENN